MPGTAARRYVQIALFRFALAVLALWTSARAGHLLLNSGSVWTVASLLALGASACLIWPLVVPAANRTMSVYSVAPAFFLAGMFLLPPGVLVLTMAFAISLAGVVQGARAYRTVSHLSSSILVYGGFALLFRLGPRPSDFMFQPAPRAGLEFIIAGSALLAGLLLRSLALRLEQGYDTPRWGAFQKTAIVESMLCLAFAVSITVLARIHPSLLTLVFVEIGAVWWFLRRYSAFASGAKVERVKSKPRPARAASPARVAASAARGAGAARGASTARAANPARAASTARTVGTARTSALKR